MTAIMKRNLLASRGTTIDTDKCVDLIGNRFDLVLVASARARELIRQHIRGDNSFHLNAPVAALIDVQESKVGAEYLKRVK